jgi:hypothetical protein
MFLGIKLEGWQTIIAIILGPLLAFGVQRWRDALREQRNKRLDILRRLLLTLKVPMAPNHVDAINSIPLEFHSSSAVMEAWRLYTSHLNERQSDRKAWGAKKFDLLVDLVYQIAQQMNYSHIDKALLRDSLYVPQGYQDAEEELRLMRGAWLQVLQGKRPLPMTMVAPVQIESPIELPANKATPKQITIGSQSGKAIK